MTPARLQLLQSVAVGTFVVLLMLSVGLDLSLDRILATLRRPAALLAGLAVQYLLVPLVAWAAASGLALGEAERAGLLLCAVAPGGPMGAFLALQARGDVALGAAVVLVSNVLNTLMIPIGLDLLGVAVGPSDEGHVWPMARTILLFQLLPLTVGLLIHRSWPQGARHLQRWTAGLANGLLLVFGVAVAATQWPQLSQVDPRAVLAVELTVLAAFMLGGLLSPPGRATRVALATTGVIHSVSACVLLASTWFSDPMTLLVVFAYSGCMFATGVIATRLLARLPGAASQPAA